MSRVAADGESTLLDDGSMDSTVVRRPSAPIMGTRILVPLAAEFVLFAKRRLSISAHVAASLERKEHVVFLSDRFVPRLQRFEMRDQSSLDGPPFALAAGTDE